MKKMELASGSTLDYPSSERVMEYLDKLSPDSEFLVLKDTSNGFVQVMWGPRMGEQDGTFVVETKGPHVTAHVRTTVKGLGAGKKVFGAFLDDDTSWADELEWEPVDLGRS